MQAVGKQDRANPNKAELAGSKPVKLMHGEKSIHMVWMLLEKRQDVVGIKAGLALLKKHLDSLQCAVLSACVLHLAVTTVRK